MTTQENSLYSLTQKPFDYIFHSDIYNQITKCGPLKVPGSEDVEKIAISLLRTSFEYHHGLAENKEEQDAIEHNIALLPYIHLPFQRNWTQAVNGICQGGITMLFTKAVRSNLLKNGLRVGGLLWMGAGIRHLNQAGYHKGTFFQKVKGSKFVWEK